ncbi:MAG: methylated-DNA--[protein]-cysteine S-methyltransferase [bacterium]
MKKKRYIWKNESGWLLLEWTEAGVTRFIFGLTEKEARRQNGLVTVQIVGDISKEPKWVKSAVEWANGYFEGKRAEFPAPLDFSEATEFRRGVWKAAMKIKYGKTRSYGELAKAAGDAKAARAVGNALGANPVLVIVPCHRVLKSDGSLGGFSSGLEVKKALLSLEKGGKADYGRLKCRQS